MPTEIADPLELHVVDLINAEREQAGLQPVHVEVHLNSSAQSHSDWMADEQQLSHTGENGSTPSERADDAEFPMEGGSWKLTENVAFRGINGTATESDLDEIHNALMNSPSHRENILDPDVDYVGVGLSFGKMEADGGSQDVVFLTQNFAQTSQPVIVQEEIDGQTFLTTYIDGEPVPGSSRPAPDEEGDAEDPEGEDEGDTDQSEEDPQNPQTGSGGGCFVATAAYGDRLHPDVVMLRRFRDQVLVSYPAGRVFIRTYWIIGPVLAKVVHPDRTTGRLSRLALRPCIAVAQAVLDRRHARTIGTVLLAQTWRSPVAPS